ncbi:MAG: hypothetical protein LAO06_03000 [Acidobacteriia bacterium]|nr:hypothetical protein [Terriglobia bacterium]
MAFAQGAKISAENPAENENDRPQERAKWFLRGRMVNGKPGAEQLHRAYNQKLNNRRLQGLARDQTTATQGATAAGTASPRPLFVPAPSGGAPWNFLGPAPTATSGLNTNPPNQQNYGPAVGRVTSVVVDQSDSTGNTVYLGGASGGVWKTTNAVSATRSCDSNGVCAAPVTWTPLTDGQATLTVGAIALQPGNTSLILAGSGEANNSADSYYGLGMLRSTDRGANWTLISSASCPTSNPACPSSGSVSFHGLGFTRIAFSTDNTTTLTTSTVVATTAAASGGLTVGAETAGSSARGIYYSIDAGATWTRANVSDGAASPDAGSANSVIYNPTQKKFYANLRYHGLYSSADGANWTRLANQPGAPTADLSLTACPSSPFSSTCSLYRAEMAIVPGRDEMYVWIYNAQETDIGIWQTKNGGLTWTAISTTGIDNCGDSTGCGVPPTGQGTYNITLAAVPEGDITDLYAGGVNEYKCRIIPGTGPGTNPTCASLPFLNLTHVYGCSPSGNAAHVHPDEHGIDFLGNDVTGAFVAAHPGFDPPIFFGNDGGIYRVAKGSLLTSGTCPPGTPQSQFDNLSNSAGFSMIQFVGFSHHATDPTTLVGGTQDNGSPAVSSASPSSGNWLSVNNGDGGFNAINPLSGNEWFTSNPAPLKANGGIQRCTSGISCTNQTFTAVVTQDKIGGDYSSFYTFFMLDPQASGRMLVGSCRVWRGNSDGTGSDWSVAGAGGNPLTFNLDTGVVASCGDPTLNPSTFMVNTIAAGGPCNGPCDPGIPLGSGTGGGSQVIWAGMEGIADSTNAATECTNGKPCGGQVWRTLAADSGTSSWSEVSGINNGVTAACTATSSACNINPNHYTISGIALDPSDSSGKTAFVTVMGFGVGHVFKTADAGAHWAKLDGDATTTGLPDAPADAVVIPPASAVATYPSLANVIYVGTDVGVFWSTGDGVWTEVGPSSGTGSLPNVTVTQLKIYNNPSDTHGMPLRLRASTYGRGIWEISIAPVPTFLMTIPSATVAALVGQTAVFNGTISLIDGYNYPISISCQPIGGASLPSIGCAPQTLTPSSGATSLTFSISAGDSAPTGNSGVNQFNFNIVAVGGDPSAITQQVGVTLNSVNDDFTMSALSPASASVTPGQTVNTSFTLLPNSSLSGTAVLTCSGLPAAAGPCAFAPSSPSLTAGQTTPTTVNLTIPTSTAAPGTYTVTVTASVTLSVGTVQHSQTLSLTIMPFTLVAPAAAAIVPAGAQAATSFSVTSASNAAAPVTMAFSCSAGLPAGAGPCSFSPAAPTIPPATTASVNVTIPTSLTTPVGTYTVTITATGGGSSQQTSATLTVLAAPDFTMSAIAPASQNVATGQTSNASFTLMPNSTLSGAVNFTCSGLPAGAGSCAFTPPLPSLAAEQTTATTVNLAVPMSTAAPGTYTITVTATVSTPSGTVQHAQTLSVTVIAPDFTMSVLSPASVTAGGGQSANASFTLMPNSVLSGAVVLNCIGLPTGAGPCAFTPASPSLTGGQTSATTVALAIPISTAAVGTYPITITATVPSSGVPHSQTLSLIVSASSFSLSSSGSISPNPAKPGQTLTANVTLTSSNYSGTVSLTCAIVDSTGNSVPGCATSVTSIPLTAASTPQSASVTITTTTSTPAKNYVVTVTARDTSGAASSVGFNYGVVDYAFTATTPTPVLPGASTSSALSITALNGFIGSVAVQCSVPTPFTCTLSPASPYNVPLTISPTATINVPATGTAGGTFSATLNSNDAAFVSLAHNQSVTVTVQDLNNPTACNSTSAPGTCDKTATVKAGGSATFNISTAGVAGFSGTVTFDPATGGGCTGLPSLSTCTFSPVSVTAGGTTTLTIQTTAPSVSQLHPPLGHRTAPLYALWLTMPGMMFALIGVSSVSERRHRKFLAWIALTFSISLLLAMSACGGGGGGSTTTPPIPKPGTPAGSYTITVTGVSGSGTTALMRSTQITLQVN